MASAERPGAEASGRPLAGFVFEEDGPRYVGTDTAALAWRVGPPGKPVARGIDIVTIRDGRLNVVHTLMAADTGA